MADLTLEHFRGHTVAELKQYLGQRKIRADGRQGELAVLAFWAWKLKLPVNPSQVETQRRSEIRLTEILLSGDNQLPHPDTVKEWDADIRKTPPLTFADIFNYLINTPGIYTADTLQAYRSLDGYQFFYNGFVSKVYVHKVAEEPYVYLKTTVRRSQASTDPYHVWVIVHFDDLTVKGARCQCMAGLGEACTHVAALLFKVVAATDNGLNRNSTCTEVPCAWNDNYRAKTRPALLKDIDFRHPKYSTQPRTFRPAHIPSITSDSDDNIWDAVCQIPGTPVALHLIQPRQCVNTDEVFFDGIAEEVELESTPVITPLTINHPNTAIEAAEQYITQSQHITDEGLFQYIKNNITQEQTAEINKTTIDQSDSEQWHAHRKFRITASKMHSIHRFVERNGCQPSSSVMASIKGKTTFRRGNTPMAIRWGRDKEDTAVQMYETAMSTHHKNLVVTRCGLTVPVGDSHIGVSPDRIASCDCCVTRVVECKCPYSARDVTPQQAVGHTIKYIQRHSNGNYSLVQTHQYYTQVQAQMGVLNIQVCDFVVFTKLGLLVIPVLFDEAFWGRLKGNVDSFYLQHVVPIMMKDEIRPQGSSSPARHVPDVIRAVLEEIFPPSHQPGSDCINATADPLDVSTLANVASTGLQAELPAPTDLPAIKPSTTSTKGKRKCMWPCGTCGRDVKKSGVACDRCDIWYHFKCVGLTGKEKGLESDDWFCNGCRDA